MSASALPSISSYTNDSAGWNGDYFFLTAHLIAKDFRVRYRNMSLGVFWSLLNPLVMMGVMTFIFTKVFPNNQIPNFAVFALCGLVPYNFFAIGWITGTTSLIDSAPLIKRIRVPRFLIPIAAVLGASAQLSAQLLLLIVFVLASGYKINWYWCWLPYIWTLLISFTIGLSLIFSALNVYIRDIRYVVESANLILFWLVPIFYPFSFIAPVYREVYRLNPIAAVVLASRNILLEGIAPPPSILWRLACVSVFMLLLGLWMFRRLEVDFYNHL